MPLSGSPASPQRWRTARTALGLWPACHRQEPRIPEGGWPSTAPRFASLGPGGVASPFGLHSTRPGEPVLCSTAAVLSSWSRSTATPAPALALRPWFSVGFAGWSRTRDWRWRQQRCGLNGKTSRPPCGIEWNHHEGNRFRTLRRPGQSAGRDQDCDQKSHRVIVPILRRYAVTSAALRFALCCSAGMQQFGLCGVPAMSAGMGPRQIRSHRSSGHGTSVFSLF